MAKLYWRIKRNDKWTWVAATPENTEMKACGFPAYIGPHQLLDDYPFEIVGKPEVISHLWDQPRDEEE